MTTATTTTMTTRMDGPHHHHHAATSANTGQQGSTTHHQPVFLRIKMALEEQKKQGKEETWVGARDVSVSRAPGMFLLFTLLPIIKNLNSGRLNTTANTGQTHDREPLSGKAQLNVEDHSRRPGSSLTQSSRLRLDSRHLEICTPIYPPVCHYQHREPAP
jgi:hypothetical protein